MKRVSAVGFICFFLICFFQSIAFSQDLEAPIDQFRAKIYKEASDLIFDLESQHPDLSPELRKIRERAHNLYKLPKTVSGRRSDRSSASDSAQLETDYQGCEGLSNEELKRKLHDICATQVSLGYSEAKKRIFLDIDNNDKWVECIYTGRVEQITQVPKPEDMNIEHSWPQSHGATGIAKSDMHHLFATDSLANNHRGNLPFGEVAAPTWEQGGSKCDGRQFEVRPAYRGDIARAKFYFSVRYNKSIDRSEEETLKKWHHEDPVDSKEKSRNERINDFQKNRNPFVDHSEFIDKIADF